MINLTFGASNGFTLCAGIGKASRALNAFDAALIQARIGQYNLIRVSSILPPFSQPVESVSLPGGSLLPIAYCYEIVEEPGIRIVATVAVAIPQNPSNHGVIMEYHGKGTRTDAEAIVQSMAEEAMSMRGIPVRQISLISEEIVSDRQATCVFAGVALFPLNP
jgi:arginine decarboxylase